MSRLFKDLMQGLREIHDSVLEYRDEEWTTLDELINRRKNRPALVRWYFDARANVYAVARYIRYDIHQGFYGLWYWKGFAWSWRTWEFEFVLPALQKHLVKLEVAIREGHGARREKEARDIRIALEYLKRVLNDPYSKRLMNDEITVQQYKNLHKRDWNAFCDLIKKRGRSWWD